MRYGFHHARSTDALAWLLVHDEPVPPEEYPVLLSCRAALLAAHRERCERTVRGADVQVVMFNNRRLGRDLAVLARGGATALGILLDEYPAFPEKATPFTDVLQMENLTPQAHAWVEASRHAVLATEAAVTSTSWTERPDQAWQVVADIADSAQALVRLDARLSATNPAPLPDWAMVLRFPAAELNLTSRHLGYVARSGHLDAGVDATSRIEMQRGLLRVHDLANVVDGARSLASYLTTTPLSVPDLRGFSIMHSELCHLGAEVLSRNGATGDPARLPVAGVALPGGSWDDSAGQEPAPEGQCGGGASDAGTGAGRRIGGTAPRRSSPWCPGGPQRRLSRHHGSGRPRRNPCPRRGQLPRGGRRRRRTRLAPHAPTREAQAALGDEPARGVELGEDTRLRRTVGSQYWTCPGQRCTGDSIAASSRDRLRVALSSDQPLRRPAAPNRRLSQRRL